MKKLFILLFLCAAILLFAQGSPVSPLDLGDVIIEGESDLIKDSLGTNYDLDSLLNIGDSTKFLYKPEPVVEITKDKSYSHSNKLFRLETKAGNNTFGSLKAAYSSGDLLNFNLTLYNRSLEKDWKRLASNFNWLPAWGDTEFNLNLGYLENISSQTESKAAQAGLGITRIASKSRGAIAYPGFNLTAQYYRIEATDIELSSIDLRGGFDWTLAKLNLVTELGYLKEKFLGSLKVYYRDLPINQLGLYLHYKPEFQGRKEKIEVSVDFFNRFKLAESVFMNISNKPYLSQNSYLDDIAGGKYQKFQENSNQYSILMNPELALEYFGLIYLKAYYNYSIINDLYFFLPDSSGVYYLSGFNKVDSQKTGFNIVFNYKELKIGNDFTYLKQEVDEWISEDQIADYEDNIPYIPELTNLTYFSLNIYELSLKLENELLSNRKDEQGKAMKDLNLINLRLSYKLFEQLEILTEAENLLNAKYMKASYLPEEGLQLKAGFRWSF